MRPAVALPLALLLPVFAGCAAKTTADIMQAEQVLLDARAAGAAEYAPYQLTLAETYLLKAREEWAGSQYEDANRLAASAMTHAVEAERLAIQEATMGEGAEQIVPEEVQPTPQDTGAAQPEEPPDEELLELIQDDEAEGDDTRRPTMMDEEKLDEDQFEVDE